MTKRNPHVNSDDLPSELHKALIECGAVIPTTPEEVLLAERHHKAKTSPEQIEAAFQKLEMAPRNGQELDETTRAKIEASVEKVLRKPSQDSK